MKVTWWSRDFHFFAEKPCGYVCMLLYSEQCHCRTKNDIHGTLILYIANTAPAQVGLSQTRLPIAGHPAFPPGSVHGLALHPAAARACFMQPPFL